MKLYLKYKILNLIDIKELTAAEYLNFEGEYKDYVEKHDFWELCFVEKGKIDFAVDGINQVLSENSLVLISPEKLHSYSSENGNENKVFVICFQCFSQSLRPLSEIKFDLNAENCSYMKNIIKESLETFRMNENEYLEAIPTSLIGGQQMIILLLECLLINLLRLLSSNENSSIVFFSGDNFYQNLVETIIMYLKENINKKLSLDDICDKFNYSKSFLCKIFKNQTNDTIMSYFNKIKINEAKNLLVNSNMKITAISSSLGFQEVKYFDYIFKKYVGISPANFRERELKKL